MQFLSGAAMDGQVSNVNMALPAAVRGGRQFFDALRSLLCR
jgi:hypothetical protein